MARSLTVTVRFPRQVQLSSVEEIAKLHCADEPVTAERFFLRNNDGDPRAKS